jgi:hypothetical protein
MSKNKGAKLIPESQLTDDELEQVAGGLLPAVVVSQPILIGLDKPGFPSMPVFNRPPLRAGDGCGTDDSGAMGCPG